MYDGTNPAVAVTADPQTIKYWDYSADAYTFTAVSAKEDDITSGRVVIQKNTTGTDNVYQKGYTITLDKTGTDPYTYPTLNKLYFADRKVITRGDAPGSDRNAVNAYGGNVTLTFRNLVSQIRAGVYETINGYDITEIKFFVNTTGGSPTQTAPAKVSETDAFGAVCKNTAVDNYTGTLTVTYYTASDGASIENQPKVTATGTPATNLILGTNMSTLSTTKLLGQTSASPTWDKIVNNESAYTEVLPQIDNNDNLKLKVNYKLWNSVTKEVINVTGATAEIPAEYLRWKPNYRYTYLFKISDNSNGQTGTGTTPAGLYPITFDALVMEAEDGKAEYITTVSEPSITTFGTQTAAGKTTYVTGGNDYAAGTAVYAVVEYGSSLATLSSDNMQLYTVSTTDATKFPITEASVAEALIEAPTLNAAQASAAVIKFPDNPSLTYQNTVPAEDGTTITLDESVNKAATFTTAANTKYALVYEKTPATYTYDSGKNDYTSETFTAAGTLYTRSGSGTDESPYIYTKAASWTDDTKYFKRTAVSDKGVYVIKIVTCPGSGS